MRTPSAFARYAWIHLGLLLFVIVYGAWVRITGSGAGCGSHWPTCNGEVIPHSPSIETMIEFGHRASSGLLGLMALGLVIFAFRATLPRRARIAACVTLLFVIIEALVGAGLVLGELVKDDASVARAVVIALHLVNTLALTAAATLTAAWSTMSQDDPGLRLSGRSGAMLILSAIALVLICMTGAVTALGDTLFPPGANALGSALAEGPAHFLVRLRIFHPALAVIGAIIVLVAAGFARSQRADPKVAKRALMLQIFVVVQVMAGVMNIVLDAPSGLQLVHLLLAQTVWVHLVLLALPSASELVRLKAEDQADELEQGGAEAAPQPS